MKSLLGTGYTKPSRPFPRTRARLAAAALLLALAAALPNPAPAQTQAKPQTQAQNQPAPHPGTPAPTLRVAAAADLRPVMPVLAAQFQQQTGVRLQVSFASSATLATQILNGAPFDLFLAADFIFPEKVVAANLATEKQPVEYAHGALVLWVPSNSPIQPPTVEKLLNPAIQRIAIADEYHAPFGRAAYAALRALKVYDQLAPRLVVAENIAQAAQFVQSGNAQAGFLSLTLANSPELRAAGSFTRVPRVYPEIRQCAVVLAHAANAPQAQQFLTWLLSDPVQRSLPPLGLDPVN